MPPWLPWPPCLLGDAPKASPIPVIVNVVTAGTLVADDGETPVGSIFVVDAQSRAAVDAFARSDPYHVNRVWEQIQIHGYNKKRGSPTA